MWNAAVLIRLTLIRLFLSSFCGALEMPQIVMHKLLYYSATDLSSDRNNHREVFFIGVEDCTFISNPAGQSPSRNQLQCFKTHLLSSEDFHLVFQHGGLICLSPCWVASKTDSKIQRRPRSTSMKDRQNSKAQSDRTSSIESETSPDSRLITQVCVSVCLCLPG